MANIIDSLLITMGLDGSGVSKGMDEVESRLAGGVKNITTNILAPLAGAFAFGALLNNFTSTADALGKLSKSLRADTQDVKAWGDAVEYAGGDANSLNSTLSGLEQKLKDAKRGIGNADFRALGINAKDANGNLKTSTDILKELSLVGDKMNPEKFERLTKKLGIDSGTLQLLQSGSKEVDKLVSKYKDLAYTQKDAETAREFNRTMDDLNKTFQAGAAIFMRYLVPALTIVAQKAEIVVNFLRKHEKFVLLFFTLLAAVIAYKLTPAIWAMSKAWLANPMVRIIGLVLLLALALDDLWSFVKGSGSAIEDLMRKLGASEETIESVRSGAKEFLDVMIKYGPALGIVTAAIKGVTLAMRLMGIAALSNPVLAILFAIAAAATYIIANWEDVAAFFSGFGEKVKNALAGVKEFLVGLIPDWLKDLLGIDGGKGLDATISEAKENLGKAISDALPSVDDVLGGLKNAGQAVKDFGSGLLDGASNFFGGLLGGDASAATSPALAAAGPVDNSVTEYNQNVTVNATSSDPAGIARETGSELRRMTATVNKGVRQ